jgi:hypothetical protein
MVNIVSPEPPPLNWQSVSSQCYNSEQRKFMYVYSDFKLPVAEIILDFSDDLQSNF